jgi:hypothetical protein
LPPFPLPILQKVVDDRQNVSFAFLESLQNQYPPLDGCHHCTLVYVPEIKLIDLFLVDKREDPRDKSGARGG